VPPLLLLLPLPLKMEPTEQPTLLLTKPLRKRWQTD
jgi:hypothetical protein